MASAGELQCTIGTRLTPKNRLVFEWPWKESRNVGLNTGDFFGVTLLLLTTHSKSPRPWERTFLRLVQKQSERTSRWVQIRIFTL